MKYKHKPIPENERICDAILHDGAYIVVRDGLPNVTMRPEEFDAYYEPLKREPRTTGKKPPKKASKPPAA